MQASTQGPLSELGSRFSDYLPTLSAGLLLVGLGIVAGWLAKRTVVAFLNWVRFDRLGGPAAWRAAFAKADVRAALYNTVGTGVMVLVLLVFIDNALQIWGLTVLLQVVDRFLGYLPNLALVGLIVGVGLFLSNLTAERVENALEEAAAPNPRLLAGMTKAALLAVVAALALWELDFARQVVMGAFLIGFGAIGVAFALGVGLGSAPAIRHGVEEIFARRRRDRGSGE